MRRKKGMGGLLFAAVVVIGIGGAFFVFNSAMFERELPEVHVASGPYWDGRTPLKVTFSDAQSGLKRYKVAVIGSDAAPRTVAEETFATPVAAKELSLKAASLLSGNRSEQITLRISVGDASRWHFFAGNSVEIEKTLTIDGRRPNVSVVANSYKITHGGAALVVFRAEDEHLDSVYIDTVFGKRFKVQPFYAKGYYIALIAWPVTEERFRADVVARDLAGNESRVYIPLHLKEKHYKVSKINLSDQFLGGKVTDLAYMYGVEADANALERFRFVNETLRVKNEALIHDITSRLPETAVETFSQRPFYPLKNGKVVAGFGDHRLYYYEGEQVSESYHLGLDLASIKMGEIMTQNPGDIVFANENGIYGNMPILAHGLGLYTLYGHCSSLNVAEGDHVSKETEIARTGTSGYAMGDHLHFGVLVQGVEVRPEEWMDRQWIQLNVTDVIDDAKSIIKRRQ